MESTKRRNSTDDFNMNKKRNNNDDITRFEDLSNELICEIIDYLDSCQAYDVFFNLNSRFRELFHHSSLPIRINFLTTLSRYDFQRYYNQIILPNQQQVQSIQLSNPFLVERLFSSTPIFLNFIQLQSLVLNPIESIYMETLLDYLLTLPKLSSLVLICTGFGWNRDRLYEQIFRLPALTYCKLSLTGPSLCRTLPMATNQFSSIENLILTSNGNVNELPIVLSYVPRLKHLSIRSFSYSPIKYIQQPSIQLPNLTHVSLDINYLPYDDFEFLVRNYFHHIQVLHISTKVDSSLSYLDADQWQRLILSSMSSLRIFDVLFLGALIDVPNSTNHIRSVNKFQSSFWSERQWKFSYSSREDDQDIYLKFFSNNPYRRKQYTLDRLDRMNKQKISFNSVEHLKIYNIESIGDIQISFPNAIQLTIVEHFSPEDPPIISNNFTQLLPLDRLTGFFYHTHKCNFLQVIQLLQHMPNIEIFEILLQSLVDFNFSSIQQNDIFQIVSQKNKITTMILADYCTTKDVNIFFELCPRLKELSIEKCDDISTEFLVQDLLPNIQSQLKDLRFLSVTYNQRTGVEQLKTLLESEKLLDGCSMNYDRYNNSMLFWF